MLEFMLFITIASAIFSIVCLCKWWGMVNDVKEINHNLYEIGKAIDKIGKAINQNIITIGKQQQKLLDKAEKQD